MHKWSFHTWKQTHWMYCWFDISFHIYVTLWQKFANFVLHIDKQETCCLKILSIISPLAQCSLPCAFIITIFSILDGITNCCCSVLHKPFTLTTPLLCHSIFSICYTLFCMSLISSTVTSAEMLTCSLSVFLPDLVTTMDMVSARSGFSAPNFASSSAFSFPLSINESPFVCAAHLITFTLAGFCIALNSYLISVRYLIGWPLLLLKPILPHISIYIDFQTFSNFTCFN